MQSVKDLPSCHSDSHTKVNFAENGLSAETGEVTLEFFTVSLQYKNAKIANFVLALPLKNNWFNAAFIMKM